MVLRQFEAFLDDTPEEIKQQTQFYWLSSHVLKMSIGTNETTLTIYINFGDSDYTLEQPIKTIFPLDVVDTTALLKNSVYITT